MYTLDRMLLASIRRHLLSIAKSVFHLLVFSLAEFLPFNSVLRTFFPALFLSKLRWDLFETEFKFINRANKRMSFIVSPFSFVHFGSGHSQFRGCSWHCSVRYSKGIRHDNNGDIINREKTILWLMSYSCCQLRHENRNDVRKMMSSSNIVPLLKGFPNNGPFVDIVELDNEVDFYKEFPSYLHNFSIQTDFVSIAVLATGATVKRKWIASQL